MFIEPVKIKIKTLAMEAKYIKKEERKKLRQASYHRSLETDNAASAVTASVWDYVRLREHRKGPVAQESRASLIAYGFIRGKEFKQIENPRSEKPLEVDKVTAMVYKYGYTAGMSKDDIEKEVVDWMEVE